MHRGVRGEHGKRGKRGERGISDTIKPGKVQHYNLTGMTNSKNPRVYRKHTTMAR